MKSRKIREGCGKGSNRRVKVSEGGGSKNRGEIRKEKERREERGNARKRECGWE